MTTTDLSKTRAGVFAAALALSAMGCDDGTSMTPGTDSGTPMDSGVDSGTTVDIDAGTDAGPADAGTTNRNILVVRLTSTGAIDTTYGGGDGKAILDLGSSNDVLTGMSVHRDGPNLDKVVLFANRTSSVANAVDTSRLVARVLADGTSLDTAGFASAGTTPGIHTFSLAGINDGAKHGHVLPDGTIIASGYSSQPTFVGMMNANRIVLVRLNADGTPMASFGANGLLNANPFDLGDTTEHGFAEAYGVTVIPLSGGGYAFATTGYGRVTSSTSFQVAQISTRFTATGAFDATWPGTAIGNRAGTVVVHPSRSVDHDSDPGTAALSFEARGRNIVTLPGEAVLAIGSSNFSSNATTNANEKDILIAPISAAGDPTTIPVTGTGTTTHAGGGVSFTIPGGVDYTDEACFGGDVAPNGNFAAVACYRAQTSPALDTDAVLGILSITTDVGGVTTGLTLTSLAALELSATENDRFDVVAFSPDSSRIYAAGYTTVGGVQQMAVACYDTAGVACAGFGTNGVVVIPDAPAITGIAIDSMGRILVGGAITETL